VLGPLLQPVGRHGPAREAGDPLWHDRRHDPLVARPIKGTGHPAWSIVVVIYQVLLWSGIKYYCGHVSSIQILWSSYFVGTKIHVKIKYLPAFFVNGLFMAQRAKLAGMARIKVWRAMLGPSLWHVGQHDTARSVIRIVPGLPLKHEHDANGSRTVPARPIYRTT
jgi:hypothetical protein